MIAIALFVAGVLSLLAAWRVTTITRDRRQFRRRARKEAAQRRRELSRLK